MTRHLRDAVRHLRRSPIFTLTAVSSLAIGIGANAAIFTIANALFFAPTRGIKDQARLVDIGRSSEGAGFDTVSFATYRDLAAHAGPFNGVYALRLEPQAISLGGRDGAERIYGEQVSASYFDVLGLEPAAGVFFRTPEEQTGAPLRKVVLSHAFWQQRFAGDASIVGRDLVLNGESFAVVGVAPEGFHGTTVLLPDVWVPLTASARGMPGEATLLDRRNNWLTVTARLDDGVSIAQARTATAAFMRGLAEAHPEAYRRSGLVVTPASRLPGLGGAFVAPFLGLLMGLVGLVLLVACTNLAGLLLARAAVRSREIAMRLALGASRFELFRLLLSESLLVFAVGGIAATAVVYAMTRTLLATLPALPFQVALDLTMDWRVIAFLASLTAATGVLTGLAPALRSARGALLPALKSDATGRRRHRLRHAFLAAQIAFCVVLMAMAGLFTRALDAATRVDAGFVIDRIEVARLDLALGGYPEAQGPAIAEEIAARFSALPGVAGVGIARMVPLEGSGMGLGALRRPGTSGPAASISAEWNVVSPGFIDTLRIPIVSGRNFTGVDREGAPRAAIVNEHFASAVWPGQHAVGQVLEHGDFRPGHEETIERLTVVGVAKDVKYRWLGESPRHFIYVPLAQQPMRSLHYFIRRDDRAAATASLQPAVRRALAAFDADLPLVHMAPFRDYADIGLVPQRLAASVAGSLGLVALALGAIGIYGVTAFSVASRTREIGVRMALGADRARIMRGVLGHGLRLAAMGGGVGLLAALGLGRLVASLLFGISPVDPAAFGLTVGAMVAVTMAAGWMPARRAASTDPVLALRTE